MTIRQEYRKTSNNAQNPNKNICALFVAEALGVADTVRYLHNADDVKRAARSRYSVRSVKSAVKSDTVGGARKRMPEIGAEGFIVIVDGHVLLLDAEGRTIVDTAPRKRDRRRIVSVYGLYPKG